MHITKVLLEFMPTAHIDIVGHAGLNRAFEGVHCAYRIVASFEDSCSPQTVPFVAEFHMIYRTHRHCGYVWVLQRSVFLVGVNGSYLVRRWKVDHVRKACTLESYTTILTIRGQVIMGKPVWPVDSEICVEHE